MDHNDILAKLVGVAEDWEIDILERLAVRAGLWWRCGAKAEGRPDGCGWINDTGDAECGGCGANKEKP